MIKNDKRFSLTNNCDNSSDVRWVSNTHLTSTLEKNFCIDYFSMVIVETFDFDSPHMRRLFKSLKIDKNKYSLTSQHNGYKYTLVFEEFIFLSYGGTTTESNGIETIHLEMKGEGCRKLEQIGGDWKELLECAIYFGIMKRIDLAMDDFTGTINYDELIKKCWNHEYCSISHKPPVVMCSKDDGKYNSFSVTFGSRNSERLLQIYDKKTERESKNYNVVTIDNWTRFEARYRNKFADEIKDLVLISLYENNFDIFVKGIIKSVVEFKVPNNDVRNRGRADNRDVWDKLLDGADRVDVRCQYDLEKSIVKKAHWMKKAVSKTLKTIFLSNPMNFNRFINYLLSTDLEKLENIDLSVVNDAKNNYVNNISFKDVQEMADFLKNNLEGYDKPNDYIKSLLWDGGEGE